MTANAASESQSNESTSDSDGNQQQMIKRVIGQREAAREDLSTETDINQELLTRNANLQRQIDVFKKAGGGAADQELGEKPTLESCGGDSAKYETEVTRYLSNANAANVQNEVKKQIQATTDQSNAANNDQDFQEKVGAHYDRAQKMEVTDYEQAETEALNIMGSEIVEGITKKIPNSEELIYMLGKQPKEALRIKNLFLKDPSGATIEIGRLSATAVGFKSEQAADPESDIAKGGQSDGQLGVLERKLDKAFDKASENGDLTEVRAIKKDMKALLAKN